ncbi:S1 RNA-binding domain-containing protein [Helicobacter sp.]|uniref:CvfB family protein n=1 Tax=Helicobacter sp. TaxID=218 RepID=UPI0025BF8C1C|nr:S1-like domain-containing RNA-binding protein [Helicobacter sp.]MCI5968072.1 S1-like domain-containing RNA-binding protein [Helicobacter sp.]MDY2584047.1 S1-like domain-containing RNA-binding protein [Helicobacter sp.]
MKSIGLVKTLEIVRFAKQGAYLLDVDEVLLPNVYVPSGAKIGDKIEVFLYTDSSDRPVATTLKPKAQRGEIAVLKVVDKNHLGCFLDLGVAKDVFMPTKIPQNYPIGSEVAVFLTLDRENRLLAKENIKPFLCDFKANLKTLKMGDKVEILPFRKTPLGFECVVNGENLGLLYHNEIFGEFVLYTAREGYIKRIYPNGKCDLSLKHPLSKNDKKLESKILLELLQVKGVLELNYDSKPLEIYAQCNMSKKAFKRALSVLINEGKAVLENNRIRSAHHQKGGI